MISTFPVWNEEGLVPPVDLLNPTSRNRSPYAVSLSVFVQRFATSPERVQILRGFLAFRAALHEVGLVEGFQWLNGSFLEDKERLKGVAPGDIDVVTYFQLPIGVSESELLTRHASLFEHDEIKATFHVDSFPQPLYVPAIRLINSSNYWYGMWSHQRDTLRWKGFATVDLAASEDENATQLLTHLSGELNP